MKKAIRNNNIKSEKKHYKKLENILSKTLSNLAKKEKEKINN